MIIISFCSPSINMLLLGIVLSHLLILHNALSMDDPHLCGSICFVLFCCHSFTLCLLFTLCFVLYVLYNKADNMHWSDENRDN
uniref:Uncharacterized protein n=1 Tax=Anguilla anguilla TaxID=7936 RepID=A0A0E9V355_ANGAN